MKNKISENSRYWDALQKLRGLCSSWTLFPTEYNEDKQRHYTIYDSEMQSEISPIKISAEIENNVKEYLAINLYTTDEKKLLIENLMPIIESFGKSSINEMRFQIMDFEKNSYSEKDGIKSWGEVTEKIVLKELHRYPLQIQKNVTCLIETRELLVKSFNLFYKEIISQKEIEANEKSEPLILAGDWNTPEITELINYYFDRLEWSVVLLRNMMYVLYPDEKKLYKFENEPPYFTLYDINFDGFIRRLAKEFVNNTSRKNEILNNIINAKIEDIEKLLFDEKFITHYNKFKTDEINCSAFSKELYTAQALFTFKVLLTTDNRTEDIVHGAFENYYNALLNSFNEGISKIRKICPGDQKMTKRIEVTQFIPTDTFDYDAHYEKLGIAKVINSYFDNLAYLVNTMQYFNIPPDSTGYSIFIRKFGEVSFIIDIDTLCRQIEIYLLNKPENKENLTNIISVKIKHIQGLLSSVKSIRNYEQIKSEKLNIPVQHGGLDATKLGLLSMEPVENKPNTYYNTYGTLESFYKATLGLFNEATERINSILKIETKTTKEQIKSSSKTEIQMHNFNEFITQVQTIEIKIKEYYVENGEILDWTPEEVPNYNLRNVKKQKFQDLSHYDQKKSNYGSELRRLQQLAINEALLLNPEQLKLQLNRLKQINKRQKSFWPIYMAFCKNPKEQALFEQGIDNLFIITRPSQFKSVELYNMAYSSLHDWHDAIMFKQSYLGGFEKQIIEALGIKDTNTEQPKQEVVSPPEIENSKYNTLEYALFHYYKQEGKHESIFEKNSTTTKREAMKQQGIKYKVGGDAFANCYYSMIKKNKRINKTNISHIQKAVELLSAYPAGKEIAEAELKEAELLP